MGYAPPILENQILHIWRDVTIYSLYILTCCCNLVKVKEEYALIFRLAYLLWLYSFTNILYYYSGFSYSLAIYMSYYLIFLALTVSKLVIYRRKKDYISHIKNLRLGKSLPIVWN